MLKVTRDDGSGNHAPFTVWEEAQLLHSFLRKTSLEGVLREMVDRWEPDGGSDKRLWDRARELLGYEPSDAGEQK
jgi:hypothetical protein